MSFAKTVTNPVEALVIVGEENTQLHEELLVVNSELDLFRDCVATIARLPGGESSFEKAKLWAEMALRGVRMPEWRTAGKPREGFQ